MSNSQQQFKFERDWRNKPVVSEIDGVKLKGKMLLLFEMMKSGQWVTSEPVMRRIDCKEAAATARIRDLRKPQYGGHTVNTELRGGVWHYQLETESKELVPPNPQKEMF